MKIIPTWEDLAGEPMMTSLTLTTEHPDEREKLKTIYDALMAGKNITITKGKE